MYCIDICLKRLNQGSRSADPDLKPGIVECEAVIVTTPSVQLHDLVFSLTNSCSKFRNVNTFEDGYDFRASFRLSYFIKRMLITCLRLWPNSLYIVCDQNVKIRQRFCEIRKGKKIKRNRQR